ncbi:hypothetical protein V6N11_076366 [Hibiscus sabdariffa]|uniref:Sieve element occlusion C-terminal domain-containing protein n=1 Tax=Hibiscus sabdariffa TaxID=183260 RepID=A0ABR2Q624_9ROSI
MHMMLIWGSSAFPFTTLRERSWREEKWTLDLLVDGIDPTILNWIKEGKYIFLYGGDNVKWVRRFTATASGVADASGIALAMFHVGKTEEQQKGGSKESDRYYKLSEAEACMERSSHFVVLLEQARKHVVFQGSTSIGQRR